MDAVGAPLRSSFLDQGHHLPVAWALGAKGLHCLPLRRIASSCPRSYVTLRGAPGRDCRGQRTALRLCGARCVPEPKPLPLQRHRGGRRAARPLPARLLLLPGGAPLAAPVPLRPASGETGTGNTHWQVLVAGWATGVPPRKVGQGKLLQLHCPPRVRKPHVQAPDPRPLGPGSPRTARTLLLCQVLRIMDAPGG